MAIRDDEVKKFLSGEHFKDLPIIGTLLRVAGNVTRPALRILKNPKSLKSLVFDPAPPKKAYLKEHQPMLSTDIEGTLALRGTKLKTRITNFLKLNNDGVFDRGKGFRLIDRRTKFAMKRFTKRGGLIMLNTGNSYWLSKLAAKRAGIDMPISSCNGTYITVPGMTKPLVDAPMTKETIDLIEKIVKSGVVPGFTTALCGVNRKYRVEKSSVEAKLWKLKESLKGPLAYKISTGLKAYKEQKNGTYLMRLIPATVGGTVKEGIVDYFRHKTGRDDGTPPPDKTSKKMAQVTAMKQLISVLKGNFDFIEDEAQRKKYEQNFYALMGGGEAEVKASLAALNAQVDISFGDIGLEINAKGHNKGTAMKTVAEHYGQDMNYVFAAGDGSNDLPMFGAVTELNRIFLFDSKPGTAELLDAVEKRKLDPNNLPQKTQIELASAEKLLKAVGTVPVIKAENERRLKIKQAKLVKEFNENQLKEINARIALLEAGSEVREPTAQKAWDGIEALIQGIEDVKLDDKEKFPIMLEPKQRKLALDGGPVMKMMVDKSRPGMPVRYPATYRVPFTVGNAIDQIDARLQQSEDAKKVYEKEYKNAIKEMDESTEKVEKAKEKEKELRARAPVRI
ncbi:MAG: HAD family hydrolase [Firmicutes bacterium]|nr:HAD family hydrolase [Bacillota bacterium]